MAKFKQAILDKIKADSKLFALVCDVMKVQPQSLAANINRNGPALNQGSVLLAVADYLKKKPKELLEEESLVKEAQR